jgi:hypothetical protein
MEKRTKDGSAKGVLKKRHLGLAGLATVLMQYGMGVKTENATTDSMQRIFAAQMLAQKAEIEADREREFVRKDDLTPILAKLDRSLYHIEADLGHMNTKVSRIEGYLKSQTHGIFGLSECSTKISQR